jgi:hypothetical protein
MGRPPKPAEQVRRNRVIVMVTDRELAALRRRARAAGLPVGTLAYRLLAPRLHRRKS